MKNLIFCCILFAVCSCNTTKKEAPKMPGAYLMTSQVINDGKKDTKYTTLKQLKIYTDNMMMYTQVNPADSASSFGVGSYTSDTGTVIENVIFTSRDSIADAKPTSFTLNITKTPDGYEQVIPQIVTDSQSYKLTEIYQTVGNATTSPLDGVWKETLSYTLKGSDSTKNNRTQYKAFYAGYFMFGASVKDTAAGKSHTGIGFGTFKINGDNQMSETDLNSTYSIIAGQTFNVDIKMNGADSYQQTIGYPDGSKSVEIYERVKK